jgi:hypothetical protein
MGFDYYFAWGKFFSENLKKYNQKTIFVNTGNFYFKENLRIKKKNIVFFLQPTNKYYCSNDTLNEYNLFIDWCLLNLKEKIIFRLHPLYRDDITFLKKSTNAIIHHYKTVPLIKTLENAKLCFGLYTSALVESACLGIKSIFFFKKNIFTKFNRKLLDNKNIFLVNNYSKMKSFIFYNNKPNLNIKSQKNTKYFISKGANSSIKFSNKIINSIIDKY